MLLITFQIVNGEAAGAGGGRPEFVRPSHGTVSSPYGMRRGMFHCGIDYLPDKGPQVYAAYQGVVIFAGTLGTCGRTIIIAHDNGMSTRYCHVKNIRVDIGEPVETGKQIGEMGSSGNSTNTHLHFEIRIGKKHTNPEPYIKPERKKQTDVYRTQKK